MPRKKLNVLRWMAKNERLSYDYWRKFVAPSLGRSVKKTEKMIEILRVCWKNPYASWDSPYKAIRKIAKDMGPSEGLNAASMTFAYLHRIAKDHREKILRWRKR